MKKFVIFFTTLAVFVIASHARAEDYIQCTESKGRIMCNLHLVDFIKSVSPVLTNGWENAIQIHISLLQAEGKTVVRRSRLDATQRCYLDPFESPCLILWRGADRWQRYPNESEFLAAVSHFAIQAITLNEIQPDHYIVRISVQVMASVQKRLASIRSWFKSGGDEIGAGSWSTGTLIGSFLGSRAEAVAENGHEITLETTRFYIDIAAEAARTKEENAQNSELQTP